MDPVAPVAVTGIGCICGAGEDLGGCIETLMAGVREPKPPVRFFRNHHIVYPVFEIDRQFEREEERDLSRTAAMGLETARQAVADSGWDPAEFSRLRVGVVMGTTVGSAMNNEGFYREYLKDETPDMSPIKRFLRSNPAEVISRELNLSGPVQTVVNACSSGTDAIGIGGAWIRRGLCDVVLAGGADELCRVTYNGFISLLITSEEPCRPFDVNRKGLNLGEGAAVLLLESDRLKHSRKARERGAVLGYGAACDGYHMTAPRPDGAGLKGAVTTALKEAGLAPGDIGFVNAHGTATPDNDRAESTVLRELFPGTPFLSTKGYTGHTLGAAGAIEAALTLASLESGKLPGNVGFVDPDQELGVIPVTEGCDIDARTALSQSLAFGGNNSVLAMGRPRP